VLSAFAVIIKLLASLEL